ncbi:MAG: RNA polymerase factor sigma-54 [Eubacteriales bacterium]|nr:RNA polymerase factor sigma-54 [Eubacteriales bacterium]
MDLEMKNALQQKQVLSQKMIQSVQILEMGADEIDNFLKDMAEKNPLVDLEDAPTEERKDLKSRLEWERQNDYQNASYYSADGEQEGREDYARKSEGETLEEYLMAQLTPLCGERYQKSIFYYLVKSLNSQGYLDMEPVEMAEELEEYLEVLQSCEPAGIGARDLKECLRIQVMRMHPKEELPLRMIEECLELLGERRLSVIAKKMECSLDEVKEAAKIIYSLNPKPGNGFSDKENLQYVYPDVFVIRHRDGFDVVVNESAAVRMNINPYYLTLLENEGIGQETVDYIKKKLEQVKWATKCVDQRNQTLRKVAGAVVDWQHGFFEKGAGKLIPMRLTDIAQKTGMHTSTVSRAVRNKYLQCAYGIFPISYFFSKTIGESTPEEVKDCLRGIIEEEDKKKPKSDQKLAELLEKKGYSISRRTVAKYRTEMGIPGTSRRKEY